MDQLTVADTLEIRNLAYGWAESYDTKNKDLLRSILAQTLTLDYRSFKGDLKEGVPSEEYVAMAFSPYVIGRSRLQTQHLLGSEQWTVKDGENVVVSHHLRAVSQTFKFGTEGEGGSKEIEGKAYAHGAIVLGYKKLEGKWKISAVTPRVDWADGDLFAVLAPSEEDLKAAGDAANVSP